MRSRNATEPWVDLQLGVAVAAVLEAERLELVVPWPWATGTLVRNDSKDITITV